MADISKSVVDIGLADANVQRRLNATAEGQRFLAVWPFVSAGLDIASLTSEQVVAFIQSRKTAAVILRQEGKIEAADKLEQMEDFVNGAGSTLVNALSPALKNIHNKLVAGGVQIFEQGNVLKYVTKNGDEFAKIENGVFSVSFTKPNIPNPSTYLDATYITNHINKFKQEGAGFIVVKSWTEGGNPIYTALPSRKFVGLRSEMDVVIAKYKAQGNDWTVLRDELNLGSSTNLAAEEIYYIKIDGNDARFTFDVPNGNEGGAIAGEWVPGGYTKSGTAEAALVGSENIVHNKSINQLLNNFPGMWEKIK
ncbi:hypothetical protein [Runella sp.]|uniref:hypothetical protein n=1 Tax=Runella sp. TaxID=1960881 RepID=UPI003D1496C6